VVGRQETVVQKNRDKAVDGDRNALKQKLRLSVLAAHERHSPTHIVQRRSCRLIDRSHGLDRDRLKIIVTLQSGVFRLLARGCHLRHTARTLHGKINVRVSRGAECRQLSHPTSRICRLQKESVRDHLVSCRLDVPNQLALWELGPQQLRKLDQRDRSACDVWTIYQGPACLQTRLCRPRASTGEPHRQRWGTHKSSPRHKPTATLTASSSSLMPQDAIGKANSQSPL